MVEFTDVKSISEAYKFLELHGDDKKRLVYIYFYGAKDSTGKSWCSDCVRAFPIVMDAFRRYADPKTRCLTVDVGDEKAWRDLKNPFRIDKFFRLESIPTLLRWKSAVRLFGEQIEKPELLELLFEEGKSSLHDLH